ncbi:unnamed protein product [Eruca vesicaria subsp. sativa]|uniref:NYN domain-containing protein n=1 Tax=Eruca vesicaria subsp. sativa TaxID=29727 RepID=A0ABC8LJD6_ERUVS|nr:unnamed protein product [Eruca vesicaria subsp. sativa]
MDESNKIVDFSERVTYVEQDGGEEGIFWDVEDFPFPVNSTPDEIYKKIVSCLKEMGSEPFHKKKKKGSEPGRTTVWAYVDENKNETWGKRGGEFLSKKTWESRIYFLPGGDDKPSRRNRMLIDILLWELDHPAPASLIVVSDRVRGDKEFFGRVRSLTVDIYDVEVIAPPTRPVVPESFLSGRDCC